MTVSVFDKYQTKAWPYRYSAQVHVATIAGGTPSDEHVAEAWLSAMLGTEKDDLIRKAVAETMAERNLPMEDAMKEVNNLKHLNGFKRDSRGLFIEGRQMKASLKEAVNVAANAGKITTKGWGNPDNANYKKGIKAWFPEHVGVIEDRLHLGVEMPEGIVVVDKPTGIMQRFVHTVRGTGIQYEEYVQDAIIQFTVETDHQFTDEQWAMIWLTAERLGIGASRSQGFGKFQVTQWDRI